MMRSFTFAVYVTAAGAQLLPVLILAMSTAFSGVDGGSLVFVAQFVGLICCITLLVAAGAAVLADQNCSWALLLSGPILALILVVSLALTIFRESGGMNRFSAAGLQMALVAAGVGSFYIRMRTIRGG